MAYAPTNWQDGVTPVNAANLNKLEQGLAAAVGIPADVVVPSGQILILNRFNAGDTQPAFRLLAEGEMRWGAGGAASPDIILWRAGGSVLKTSAYFASGASLNANHGGDPLNVVVVGSKDGNSSTGPGITFGPDTNLYRLQAGVLQTDSHFISNVGSVSVRAATGYIAMNYNIAGAGSPGLGLGPTNAGPDTFLYRSSPGYLTTDGAIIAKGASAGFMYSPVAAGGLALMGQVQGESQARFYIDYAGFHRWGPGGAVAPDTTLFRAGAGVLRTDGAIEALGQNNTFAGPSFIRGDTSVVWNRATLYFQDSAAGGWLWSAGVGPDHSFSIGDQVGGKSVITVTPAGDTGLYGALSVPTGVQAGFGGVDGAYYGFRTLVGGDSNPRWGVVNNGQMRWGPGGATVPDTYLYRSGAGTLKTDGVFLAVSDIIANWGGAGHIQFSTNAGRPIIYFGTAADTFLYRASAGVLATDNQIAVGAAGIKFSNGSVQTVAAGAGGISVLARSAVSIDVVNNTVETSMFSFAIPGGTLGTDRAVRLTMIGEFKRNAGNSLELKAKWGGTTPCRVDFGFNGETNAEYQPFKIVLFLSAVGATNSQFIEAEMIARRVGAGDGANVGKGGEQNAVNMFHMTPDALAAIDSTIAQTLQFTVRWTGPDAGCSWRQRFAVLELL